MRVKRRLLPPTALPARLLRAGSMALREQRGSPSAPAVGAAGSEIPQNHSHTVSSPLGDAAHPHSLSAREGGSRDGELCDETRGVDSL